jgi:predicted nucleic acid-binding protein
VITYFDTSAIVKTVVAEDGSHVAVEIWNSSVIRVTSIVAYAEARAALAAAVRSRRLSARGWRAARSELDDRWRTFAVHTVSDDVVGLAADLTDREPIRAYDAVHLACALLASGGDDVVFATWDRALSLAAHRLGLRTNLA